MKYLITLMIACSLFGCGSKTSQRNDVARAREMLRLPRLSNLEVVESEDSHGGFHGDGEYWVKIQFSDASSKKFAEEAKTNGEWKALSEIGELSRLPLDDRLPLDLENGIYFFRDFQPEWYPEYESNKKPPHERYSYNFVFAIFDPIKNMLYVYNLDT